MTTEVANQLNSLERSNLRLCEKTIQEHLSEFVQVGEALAKIRDDQLYRETNQSFEDYCHEKWDYQRSYAYRVIAASQVVRSVAHGRQLLPNLTERIVRPLTLLPPEKQGGAWETALDRAKALEQPLTAQVVESVVREIKPPKARKTRAGRKKEGGGDETPWTCPNCGGHDKDDDGDCKACKEPAGLGKCPNCLGTKWKDEGGRLFCTKCHQPHGEPAGDVDQDRIKTQRQKTVKTADALQRAFDDLHTLCPNEAHGEAIKACKALLKTAKEWK